MRENIASAPTHQSPPDTVTEKVRENFRSHAMPANVPQVGSGREARADEEGGPVDDYVDVRRI